MQRTNTSTTVGKKISPTDRTPLIENSKEYNFRDPIPNIIHGAGDIEDSKAESSALIFYLIVGLSIIIFVICLIYIILDTHFLSRRKWVQKWGDGKEL